MKLYNSYTLKTEEFVPIRENEVSMYVCGPTVYNHAHIGNARPIVVFDTLRRTFEALGYKVKFVSNFTDVDDKIINKALEEGVSENEIAERYIKAYNDVRDSLNIIPLDVTPRVTETMDEIIDFIDQLVRKGNAYVVDGDVYFSVESDPKYGELSHQRLEDLNAGARVETNDLKRNPLDFALWKKTEKGIKWDSPWGEGRPGWHTECVVMIGKEFNSGLIDIHGGGKDLKFPHHENEVAQSECCNGHRLANYWIHNGMLETKGGKMSKSLGNTQWAKDVIAEHGANLVRWFLLSGKYRDSLIYDEETFTAAKTELTKIQTALKQVEVKSQIAGIGLKDAYDEEKYKEFLDQMADDLNTPNAYMVIFDTLKLLNQALRTRDIDWDKVALEYNAIEKMLEILGVFIDRTVLSDEDKDIYQKWNEAKAAKDFDSADRYRQILMEKGIL
ncbi:MAG: cysteine--tRNA ligase [Erysipelotrichaceae bacterium]|jgi:cysteinyl-tRNA synthetase|nr:cysteine--tRNA ligase [Erysipelotrichaceae bacterium]